jgi:hypothetical protein
MEEHDERKPNAPPLRVVGSIQGAGANETIRLDNEVYEILSQCTLEGHAYWDRYLLKGGLAALVPDETETPEAFRDRVERRVLESGVALRLMALWVVRLQENWTAERAGFVPDSPLFTTVEFLRGLTAPHDLTVVRRLLAKVVQSIVKEGVTP